MRTTAQTRAPGSRPEPSRMQVVSDIKYDLNASTEMENITLEESGVSLRPKDTRGHYAPVLMDLETFPCLPSRHGEVCHKVTNSRFCFPALSWVRGRRWGMRSHRWQEVKRTCVTVAVKKICMKAITSHILHSVIGPILTAWGDLHSQRIIGTPLVIRGRAQRHHNYLLKRLKSESLQHTDQRQNKRQYSSSRSRGKWSQSTELTCLTYVQLKSQPPSWLSGAPCPQKCGEIWLYHLLTAGFKSWFPQRTARHSTRCARIQSSKKGQTAAAQHYRLKRDNSAFSNFPKLNPPHSSLKPADPKHLIIHFEFIFYCVMFFCCCFFYISFKQYGSKICPFFGWRRTRKDDSITGLLLFSEYSELFTHIL